MTPMTNHCHQCGKEVTVPKLGALARKEECPHCSADLHVCRNCGFYDEGSYNQCRESQAERVVDKEKANFCDYFKFVDGTGQVRPGEKKTDNLKDLDDLFK